MTQKRKFFLFKVCFLFRSYIIFYSATLKATIAELNARKAAFPNREKEERSSIVHKAGLLTQEHNKMRLKMKTDLVDKENERDDIIAVKKNKLAKEQTLLEKLKSECVANKNPTLDELNLIGSQQGKRVFLNIIKLKYERYGAKDSSGYFTNH
jgi:hypothetical protein